MGQLAAIGIVKGQPFEPDERMRRILEDAAAVGNATSRALFFDPRASEGFAYYDDGSAWFNMLWVGGYTFETPPPLVTAGRDQAVPRDRRAEAALPDRRSSTRPPASRRRCACGSPESGRSTSWPSRTPTATASTARRTYRVTLPPDIPAARFWSFTALRQRDALDAPDAAALPAGRKPVLPDAGGDRERRRLDDRSRSVPSGPPTARRATGSRRPRARAGSRSCASTARSQPFFDKTWRPSEIGRA